jgi:hypothetical protein
MGLMRISPHPLGKELRMFECPNCENVVEEVVNASQVAEKWLNSPGLQRPT